MVVDSDGKAGRIGYRVDEETGKRIPCLEAATVRTSRGHDNGRKGSATPESSATTTNSRCAQRSSTTPT